MASTLDTIIQQVAPVILAIAFLIFLWGLAMYLVNRGDKEVGGVAESIMFSGVITIVITTVVWGILRILF